MKKLIEFFATKHLFSNFFFIIVFAGGIFFWDVTSKEELPDMTLNFIVISVSYPGASPQDVEQLVTWPIEKEISSINGIERITSTSKEGSASINVELEEDLENLDSVLTEIRNSVLSTDLPDEIVDNPSIKEFKTTYKAVIDVGLYIPGKRFLSDEDRRNLQVHVRNLENRLTAKPQIKSVDRNGYLDEELHILANPKELEHYQLPINTLINELKSAHSRQPAGSLESVKEERITINARLDTPAKLEKVPVQGTFEGNLVHLSKLADIKDTFEDSDFIIKLNGYEGVIISVVKSSSSGILDAVNTVKEEVKLFQESVGEENVKIILLDDESVDVRNRLSLIGSNGLLGFILILILLFIFLNFKAGFWVAMGIPFTFSMTMIIASVYGYTINNITLSAVIIVMGMIVDDAIVVSENIMRLRSQGVPIVKAAIEGTAYVLLPITASILTTIFAFLPLLAFEGRLSMLTQSIPPIVSIMLLASLIEALIILPAHLSIEVPRWLKIMTSLGTYLLIEKYYQKTKHTTVDIKETPREHWFHEVEKKFSIILERVLHYRLIIICCFIVFVLGGLYFASNTMKFVLFPREESTEISVVAETPIGTRKERTAQLAQGLEDVFSRYLGQEVVGFRTTVGRSFHRESAMGNVLRLIVELKPADERKKSLNELLPVWEKELKKIKGFSKIQIARHRWGSDSNSPIEIIVQQNDNTQRESVADQLAGELKKISDLTNIEVNRPYASPEYMLSLNRTIAKRLNIDASDAATAIRTALEGTILYQFLNGDEDKNVRITLPDYTKEKIGSLLNITVGNNDGYLVPLKNIVTQQKTTNPSEIIRIDKQRILKVFAGINPKSGKTPLDIADYLEKNVFPGLSKKNPGTSFMFDGEIKMTRESSSFFVFAAIMVIFLIYITLALNFSSLSRPFLILMAIPPAIASVLIMYMVHNIFQIGFFGVIGLVGLSGVVVNDAIILIRKLDDSIPEYTDRISINRDIAHITGTRLRAILLTTVTTVCGLFPTAYGVFGYDSMLGEMMFAIAWGLIFGTLILLFAIPSIYSIVKEISFTIKKIG